MTDQLRGPAPSPREAEGSMNEDSHPLFAPQNPNCEVQAERDNWVDPWPRPLALGPRDARRGLQHTDRTDVPPSLLAPELPCVCDTQEQPTYHVTTLGLVFNNKCSEGLCLCNRDLRRDIKVGPGWDGAGAATFSSLGPS